MLTRQARWSGYAVLPQYKSSGCNHDEYETHFCVKDKEI